MDESFHITADIVNSLACKWWADAGSCLGIVREDGFIVGDYDIDIGMDSAFAYLRDRLVNSFESFGAKMIKERHYRGRLVTLGFKRKGVKLDIFFYHQEKGFVWHALYKRGIFYPVVFDAKLFAKLKEVRFRSKTCYLPNPPEEYLEARYGEDWRVPKSEFTYWSPADTRAINMEFF